MSMVEMMIALFVLGVVLSALASVLITSVRGIVVAEREVQATALAQQEIERLQTIEWEQVALYENDTQTQTALASDWAEVRAGSAELSAAALVELPAVPTTTDREKQVPLPVMTDDRHGVTYTVLRYITWVDRSGDGLEDTKRLHIVVRWPTLTGEREIVANGERTPTQSESASSEEGVRVLSFTRSPDPAFLDDNGAVTGESVAIRVRLNRGVLNARLRYFVPVDVNEHEHTTSGYQIVNLEGVGTKVDTETAFFTLWTFTLPATDRFVPGTVPLQFRGQVPSGEFLEADSSVRLIRADDGPTYIYPQPPAGGGDTVVIDDETVGDGSDTVIDPTAVSIDTAAIPTQMCINAGNRRLSSSLTLDVTTSGLSEGDLVKVEYLYWPTGGGNNPVQKTANVDVGFVSGDASLATWRASIVGEQQTFVNGETVEFTIEARRASDKKNTSTEIEKVVATC